MPAPGTITSRFSTPARVATADSVRAAAAGSVSASPASNQPAIPGTRFAASSVAGSCAANAVCDPPNSPATVSGTPPLESPTRGPSSPA
ncbi:hypothetical protein WY02_24765 [Pseudonocardia sp. AL041005-10]|nr:hypothetical protein [Pseudonocardia sp. AL041005-10]ALE81065.1 hypothetical protein WY02_24765 [Pseudonocardia sp. AL041005-10]